jgi:hypothetical protein
MIDPILQYLERRYTVRGWELCDWFQPYETVMERFKAAKAAGLVAERSRTAGTGGIRPEAVQDAPCGAAANSGDGESWAASGPREYTPEEIERLNRQADQEGIPF